VSDDDQRRDALHKANDVRQARADLKRELKSGTTALADTIENPPGFAENMEVGALCKAARGFGRVRVAKLLARCEIAYSKRVGKLSERQRILLAHEARREHERAYAHAKREKRDAGSPLSANPSGSVHG
jgi:hypothetical protein